MLDNIESLPFLHPTLAVAWAASLAVWLLVLVRMHPRSMILDWKVMAGGLCVVSVLQIVGSIAQFAGMASKTSGTDALVSVIMVVLGLFLGGRFLAHLNQAQAFSLAPTPTPVVNYNHRMISVKS